MGDWSMQGVLLGEVEKMFLAKSMEEGYGSIDS